MVNGKGYNPLHQLEGKPMDIRSILNDLEIQRRRLERAIAALEGLAQPARRGGRPPKAKRGIPITRKRGGITPAGRKRLSELMKQRWAERKKKARKRKPMSAAARKKLSAMMKARWAELNKAKAA